MTDEKPRGGSAGTGAVPMPMCPMGETCMRMMQRPPSGLLMFIPGIVFILVGVLIAAEPAVLIWLIAAASIIAGIAMLGCAYFMRTTGLRLMRGYR